MEIGPNQQPKKSKHRQKQHRVSPSRYQPPPHPSWRRNQDPKHRRADSATPQTPAQRGPRPERGTRSWTTQHRTKPIQERYKHINSHGWARPPNNTQRRGRATTTKPKCQHVAGGGSTGRGTKIGWGMKAKRYPQTKVVSETRLSGGVGLGRRENLLYTSF